MGIKTIVAIVIFSLVFQNFSFGKREEIRYQEKLTYKIVEPTQEEIEEIPERLGYVLGMVDGDYNCLSDDMYANLFTVNKLDYVYPEYDDEVAKYIAPPLSSGYSGEPCWDEVVYEKDPLGMFGEIPESAYDKNGDFDMDLVRIMDYGTLIGYNRFSAPYIDWLIEGVWNGKVDHEKVHTSSFRTQCYYHDGFYYTPEIIFDRGGPMWISTAVETTPLEENKYEYRYFVVIDDALEPDYYTATIAMKESNSGFRFWSIFSIEQDKVAQ